jgi:choline dehydrogenase-like flavoprotein
MTDVVVVGSGPLGAVVARRCAEAGRHVLLVEQGPAISEPAGSHVRNAQRYQRDPDSYLAGIGGFFDYFDEHAIDAGLPGACTTAADGGQGVLWTNNCPLPDVALELDGVLDAPTWGRLLDEAWRYLGVTSDQFDASVRQQRIAPKLATALAATGRRVGPQPIAGYVADPLHDVVHWNATADILAATAGTHDGAVTRRRATVTRIDHDGTRATGVTFADGTSVPAGAVVVAAGAFSTPVLLHGSGIRPAALGRGLTYHVVAISQLVLDAALCAAPGAHDLIPRLWIGPSAEADWNTMVLRDVCPLVATGDDVHVDPNRLVEIQSFCPVDPRDGNVMRIDDDGTVTFDVPLSEADTQRMRRAIDDQHAIAGVLGRFRSGCEPVWMAKGFAHVMGTCRIGASPDDSVCDDTGRVHGFANLYCATVGVLPARMIVNPTLTGAALALRTADALCATPT